MRSLILALSLLFAISLSAQTIPQTGWSLVSVDSTNAGYPGTAAFDGNYVTFWHTDFSTTNPPLPHEIVIDLGAVYNLTGFDYLPRQDGYPNGDILQYNFYVSTDLTQAWTLASSGSLVCNNGHDTAKTFTATARYIRLQAITSCSGDNWTNVAELTLTGTLAQPPPTHQAALTWTDTVNPAGTTWKVYRSPGAAWNPVLLSTVTVKSYTDTTIVPGQNYVYKITALNNGVESDGPSAVTVSVQ